MRWWRKRIIDPEIAPDEIFLDASNSPDFDRSRFEGRLEKPLSRGIYLSLIGALIFFVGILGARSWNLQIVHGPAYAAESAHNSLKAVTLFAPRGVITDVSGVVLADTTERDDGTIGRNYPYPSLSHIIGYVSYPKKDSKGNYYDTDLKGVTGIEAEYDELLSGDNGQLLTEMDVAGRVRSEGTIIPAKAGDSLQLSIDAVLQEHLARAIARIAAAKGFIAGAGVVINVQTGAVRAIVSHPTYDSNVMSSGGPADVIARYGADPGKPYIDHAVQGAYAPGSVVKPLVASGVLTDGLVTEHTIIDDPGFLSLPDPYNPGKKFIFKGWKPLGAMDVRKAIAWSSDIYFYTVGGGFGSQKGLGIERLAYWYDQYGLGRLTGIAVSGEVAGLIPTPAWKEAVIGEPWYLGDTYFTAIGQYSVQVTPIQMARATAAVANGGKLFTPTLLKGQTGSVSAVPVTESSLAVVRSGMRQTVTSALASALNLPYVSVAAKTGTAQTGTRNQYDNSWVTGFFPSDDPEYAFAVVLERGPEGTGSQAVNVMREMFDSLYREGSIYTGNGAITP